ncbi:MAG: hypothetical protein M0Z46_21820 [Actinomycetota bacterium]|nr:hypothetical protein [Actinomycetota bacterium]MDA8358908.1 hypothetical protein [Actinomycetota bacterium]
MESAVTVRTETAPSGALREPVRVRFVVYGAGAVGGVNEGTALIIIANGRRLLLPVHQQQTEISDYTTAVPYDEPSAVMGHPSTAATLGRPARPAR